MSEMEKLKIKLLMDYLDDLADERQYANAQPERFETMDKLCDYLDEQEVLFRITFDLLLDEPTFGTYYDKIIPYFRSVEAINEFIDYFMNSAGGNIPKAEVVKLIEAVEAEKTSGLSIRHGVLTKVYRESEIITIPDTVHTLKEDSIGNYEYSVIRKVILPKSIRRMESAFNLRSQEFEILYQGTAEDWNAIEVIKDQWHSTSWFKELPVTFQS